MLQRILLLLGILLLGKYIHTRATPPQNDCRVQIVLKLLKYVGRAFRLIYLDSQTRWQIFVQIVEMTFFP